MSLPVKHITRQLKLVIPGAIITYYLGTISSIWELLAEEGSWGRIVTVAALLLGLSTVGLFIYVLLTPLIRGVEPNYHSWRESGILSSVIPVLTASIVTGWTLSVFALGQWTPLGYVRGIVGVSAGYALMFGLLGLMPAPRVKRT